MKTYEVYEDNGGGLFLAILNWSAANGHVCERIYENWDDSSAGNLIDALRQLRADPHAHELWDGDLAERLSLEQGRDITAEEIYNDELGLGDLIAEMSEYGTLEIYPRNMGCAGVTAFHLTEPEQYWDKLVSERF